MSFLAEDGYPGAARSQAAAWTQRSRQQPWAAPGAEPGYYEPSYPEPPYPEPGYPDPGYPDPGYPDPAYYEPAYYDPAYYEPAPGQEAYGPDGYYQDPSYYQDFYTGILRAATKIHQTHTRIPPGRRGPRALGTALPGSPNRTLTWTTSRIRGRPDPGRPPGRTAAGGGAAGA